MIWKICFQFGMLLVNALTATGLAVDRDEVHYRRELNLVESFTTSNIPVVDIRDEEMKSCSRSSSRSNLNSDCQDRFPTNLKDIISTPESATTEQSQHPTSFVEPRTLNKRATRALNHCPDSRFPIFDESVCLRNQNPQAYTIGCLHEFLYVGRHHEGQCADNEICIDGYRSPQQLHIRPPWNLNALPETAYCVSMQDFVKIAQEEANKVTSTTMAIRGGSNTVGAMVEAVMTGLDNATSLFAQSLQIQAQTAETLHDVQMWRTLVNGSDECSNCSSVRIQPLPVGTQRVKVNVLLEGAVAVGLLYLATIQSS